MKKIKLPKIRRTWKINPKTRIKESKKVYKRPREKEKLKRLVKENFGG